MHNTILNESALFTLKRVVLNLFCLTILTCWISFGGHVASATVNVRSNPSRDSDSMRTEDKPNVVIFFIDDLGQQDLGVYGSENYRTPNIDQLASKGVRFTNFYSANPVCSPTRAALMSGKAPHRLGITQWINQPNDLHLPLEEVTIGEAFSKQGYATGYIGKWHLGEKDHQMPTAQGFDWMRCVNRAGAPGSYFFPYKRKNKKQKIRYWDVPDLENREEGDYLTDELTDYAIEFIESNRSKPFLLCFAHYAVHTPIQAPKSLVENYKQRYEALPALPKPFFNERNGAKTRSRQDNPTYAAMIENLDTNVGRVLDCLKKQGIVDNTIVVFTSDNGGLSTTGRIGPTCCLPLRAGKGWTYEGGIRIPTMITWPTKIKPGVSDTLGVTMDLYPTLLDLAMLPENKKQHLDGLSLTSALKGRPSSDLQNRFLGWTYPHHHGSKHSPSNAIRHGNWKLIEKIDDETPENQRLELYDLSKDLGESKNLVKQHPEKAAELHRTLSDWLTSTTPAKNQ